jgi:predicted nucleic-acid-binding protein
VRAIDTNVIIRLLTQDDPEQFQTAKRIVAEGDIFVGSTVILECEWVLRTSYNYSAGNIARSLADLAGLPGVVLEEPSKIAQALTLLEQGMDFADALHLARSQHCDTFITFDRKLAQLAEKLGTMPVILP